VNWAGLSFSSSLYPQLILTPTGFYALDSSTPNQLILGPFHGKVACQTISFGKGVCGTAAQKVETQLVPDVEKFPGHIACDGESKSEIVVPILSGGKVVAIIDVDCAVEGGFDEVDKESLERLAKLLEASCDW
jgi:L-methionine (R)-S-oxide reductase